MIIGIITGIVVCFLGMVLFILPAGQKEKDRRKEQFKNRK